MDDKTDIELMQQALNDLEALVAYIKGGEPDLFMQVPSIEALRERLAQPEQEPVAWMYSEGLAALKAGKCWTAYGTKQDKDNSIPLYTAPPERQPLTYAEMKKIADKHLKYQLESYEVSGVFDLLRAVSEKLKEKND